MAEQEPIRINIAVDTSQLKAIQQQLQAFRESLGISQTGGTRAKITFDLTPGDTSQLQALSRLIAQQVSSGIIQGLDVSRNSGLLRALGFEEGPGGSIRRIGRTVTPTLPPQQQTVTPVQQTTPPRHLRPVPTPAPVVPVTSTTQTTSTGQVPLPGYSAGFTNIVLGQGVTPTAYAIAAAGGSGGYTYPPGHPGAGGGPAGPQGPFSPWPRPGPGGGGYFYPPGHPGGQWRMPPDPFPLPPAAAGSSLGTAALRGAAAGGGLQAITGGLGPVGNILSGAITGAVAGSTVSPGWGTAIGAVAGGTAASIGEIMRYGRQQLLAGMDEYETRVMGAMRLSLQTDQTYKQLRGTIRDLGRQYHLLGEDILSVMQPLAYTTGSVAGTEGAVRVSQAYGLDPGRVGQLQAHMALQGTPGTPDVSRLMAIYHQAGGQQAFRTSPERFAEQAVRIGAYGGLTHAPMTEDEAARWAQFAAMPGGRFQTNPAASYERLAQGLESTPSTMGQTVWNTAIAQRIAAGRHMFKYNNEWYDLRTWRGRQVYQQQSGQIAEAQVDVRQAARQLGGGSEDVEAFMYGEAISEPNTWVTLQRMKGNTVLDAQGKALPGLIAQPAPVAAEQARQAEALANRPIAGTTLMERRALPGFIAETRATEMAEEVRNTVTKATQYAVDAAAALLANNEAMKTNTGFLGDASKALYNFIEHVKNATGLDFSPTGGRGTPWGGQDRPFTLNVPDIDLVRSRTGHQTTIQDVLDALFSPTALLPWQTAPANQPRR